MRSSPHPDAALTRSRPRGVACYDAQVTAWLVVSALLLAQQAPPSTPAGPDTAGSGAPPVGTKATPPTTAVPEPTTAATPRPRPKPSGSPAPLRAAPRAPRPGAAIPRSGATTLPAPLPTPARPPAPPGLSWEDADAVEQTVVRIERRLRSGRPASSETVVVSQRQLNSYLNLSLAGSLPRGLSGLVIEIDRGRLGAHAMLDLDRVKQQLPEGTIGGLLAYLGGTVPVELAGRLSSANGTGQVQIDQATVSGMSLPVSLLVQIVSMSTRSRTQPAGVDILAPFRLPWAARQIRLEPGRALVDF